MTTTIVKASSTSKRRVKMTELFSWIGEINSFGWGLPHSPSPTHIKCECYIALKTFLISPRQGPISSLPLVDGEDESDDYQGTECYTYEGYRLLVRSYVRKNVHYVKSINVALEEASWLPSPHGFRVIEEDWEIPYSKEELKQLLKDLIAFSEREALRRLHERREELIEDFLSDWCFGGINISWLRHEFLRLRAAAAINGNTGCQS